MIMEILETKALLELLVELGETLSERTDNDIDDKVVEVARFALDCFNLKNMVSGEDKEM